MKSIRKILVPLVIFSGLIFASPVMAGSAPKINTLSSYVVKPGQLVKIKGKNFGGDKGRVLFDGAEDVKINKWSKKKVYFYVPDVETQKSYSVRVCKRGGECSKSQKIYVSRKGPEMYWIKNLITKSYNYQGSPGDKLKINGRNFGLKNIKVYFGGQSVRITSRTKKWIKIRIPNNIERDKSYTVMVTDGANPSNTQDFYVK